MAGGGMGIESGMVFGEWTVLSLDVDAGKREAYFRCRCSCGAEKSVETIRKRLKRGWAPKDAVFCESMRSV